MTELRAIQLIEQLRDLVPNQNFVDNDDQYINKLIKSKQDKFNKLLKEN